MIKNVAGKWIVFAFQDEGGTNPGEPVTGDAANITANVRIDGGAANAVDDTNPTELEDGYYVFDLTAAETNGTNLLLAPASSTANVNVIAVPGATWTHADTVTVLPAIASSVSSIGANIGTNGDALTAIPTVDANVVEWLAVAVTDPLLDASDITADMDANSTQLAAIVLDTGELQTNQGNWVTATTVDLNADQSGVTIGTVNALAAGERTSIADAILTRDWTAVTGEAARSVLNALRFLRNKWFLNGTTLTVTKEDDTTVAWTGEVTVDAGADPITGNDPA